jgi:hypothetical protein
MRVDEKERDFEAWGVFYHQRDLFDLNVLCRNYRSHNRYEVSIDGNQEML